MEVKQGINPAGSVKERSPGLPTPCHGMIIAFWGIGCGVQHPCPSMENVSDPPTNWRSLAGGDGFYHQASANGRCHKIIQYDRHQRQKVIRINITGCNHHHSKPGRSSQVLVLKQARKSNTGGQLPELNRKNCHNFSLPT